MWRTQPPIHCVKSAQISFEPRGHLEDAHVTGRIELSSYQMSEKEYQALAVMINNLALSHDPECSPDAMNRKRKEINELIEYRDRTKITSVHPAVEQEDFMIIKRLQEGIRKNQMLYRAKFQVHT